MTLSVTEDIKKIIIKSIAELYPEIEIPTEIIVEHPDNLRHGDYATNAAMALAKPLKRNPFDIANELSYKINDILTFLANGDEVTVLSKLNLRVEVLKPGFINFVIGNRGVHYLLESLQQENSSYGLAVGESKLRVTLEHSNVNPNKAAHVGHLRNACLGQFVERSLEFVGHDVEVQYYANNVGVQVVTSYMATIYIKDKLPQNYRKMDHYFWDIYSEMEQKISESEELQKERQDLLKLIDDPTTNEFKEVMRLGDKILKAQLDTFQELGMDYDLVVNEGNILEMRLWEKVFEQLKENANVYFAEDGPSKGCWLVRVSANKEYAVEAGDSEHEKDKIIVRSNGVPTYTGKDIAYHQWKFGLAPIDFYYKKLEWGTQEKELWATSSDPGDRKTDRFSNAELVVDVIDVKQTYAIDVVKQSLKFLGYEKEAENMHHVNYGHVYLTPKSASQLGIDTSDGKDRYAMSGRKGWGIKIDDLVQMVDERLIAEFGHFPALKDVRNAAIKFEMLKHNTFQDMDFDIEKALSIKGFSGPYLQYTHARCKSILEKADIEIGKEFDMDFIELEIGESEKNLARVIYRFPEVIQIATKTYSPNLLCTFLYEVGQMYNIIYNDVSILNEQNDKKRAFLLFLTFLTAKVISDGLYFLGINSPDKI